MSKFFSRLLSSVLMASMLATVSCTNDTVTSGTDNGSSSQTSQSDNNATQDAHAVNVTVDGAVDNVEFAPLSLGSVKAESWLKNQLVLQAREVTSKFEQLSPDCASDGSNKSGWLGGNGESWERGTYYVRGLITSAYVLDDEEMKAQAQKWIDWTLESQIESGAFGPYADNSEKFDYWPLMPMLMALELYCDATGDERVVPFLEKYFAWEAQALKTKPLTSWAMVRGGDNIYAVMWLYERTGDESLLDLCELLYKQTFNWESAYVKDAWADVYHIVNAQESFKLFPVMYALTGEEKYLDVYYKGVENLYMASGRQDGMANGDEMTRGIDGVFGSETCAVVERMLCDEIALYLLRDAKIADHLELVAYNALPQQLLADGKGQVYFTMQNQVMATLGSHGFTSEGGDRSVYGLPGGFPCCVHNYQMGWPLFIASMWMSTSDNGLAIGAYGPNTVKTTVGNGTSLTVTQTTNYPYEDTVNLTLQADKTDTYPLYIRIPEWCKAPIVKVNGQTIEAQYVSGEYAKLVAEWKNGDTITLTFPSEPVATVTDNNSISIRLGAVLFALEIEEKWETVVHDPNKWGQYRNYPSYNITPTSDWNYALTGIDLNDLASSFTITRNEIKDDMRYQLSDAPIVLQAQAQKVTDWTLNTKFNIAGDLPISPVAQDRLDGQTVTVRLVPYAHTRLRIALMPWSGEGLTTTMSRPSNDTILFDSVIVPFEDTLRKGAGTPLLNYKVDIAYECDSDITLAVEINRKPAGNVELKGKNGSVSLDTELLRTDYHNRISFTTSDSSPIPDGVKITLAAQINDKGNTRYEAESAKLTGSAKNASSHVSGIDSVGSSLTFSSVSVPNDGEYTLRFYYAAPMGLATHTVLVDGVKVGTVRYNENGKTLGWGHFREDIYADVTITLTKGTHTLRIEKTASDTGFAELDAIDLLSASSDA